MHTRARRLTALRVGRGGDAVLDFLDQDSIFMAFDGDLADGVGGEGTLDDVALDADVRGSWHGALFLMIKTKGPA